MKCLSTKVKWFFRRMTPSPSPLMLAVWCVVLAIHSFVILGFSSSVAQWYNYLIGIVSVVYAASNIYVMYDRWKLSQLLRSWEEEHGA